MDEIKVWINRYPRLVPYAAVVVLAEFIANIVPHLS